MKSSLKKIICCSVVLALIAAIIIIVFVVKNKTSESAAECKVVETNDGKVRGLRKITLIKQINYYSFKGIPYAKSPTGELRFKPPEPIEPWSPMELEAYEHGKSCIRPNEIGGDNLVHNENCLFLNIYVPADVKPDEKLAVMVFIHGGAFSEGSGNDDTYGGDFIVEQRTILVTFNYRLGVFGFLSFGTPEYPGNMALKDQQLAIKWVHSNIEHFSGDKQRITLFGESAGASMTALHILSPESRKFFRNAALLSGSVENFWAFSERNDHSNFAHKIAEDLGEPKQSLEDLVEFFKTVPADKIVGYASVRHVLLRTCRGIFAPVIERKDAIRPFIVDLPEKIYDESTIHVDAMFGFCSREYMTFYSSMLNEVYDYKGLDRNFTLRLPFRGESNVDYDSPEYHEIANEIRSFYFKDHAIDENMLEQYIDMLSDLNYAYGIYKSARQHTAKTTSKSFYYRFSIDSKLNVIKRFNPATNKLPKTGHAEDLCHVFRCGHSQLVYEEILRTKDDEQSKISLQAIDNITKLLSNFAKYGEPTHDGDPVSNYLPIQDDRINFLDVTNDGLIVGINPNQEANQLWSGIERKVQQMNVDTQNRTREEL